MRQIFKACLLTIAGALFVGALKTQQMYLSIVLASVLVVHLIRIYRREGDWKLVVKEAFLLLTFGVIGFLTESWGTHNGHWTYYYLPEGQKVPMWVPIAWSIASVLLHKSEQSLEVVFANQNKGSHQVIRLIGIYGLGMLLPLVGESICIALGVWEYHWPYKILGVPFFALILIAYAHFVFSLIRSGGKQI